MRYFRTASYRGAYTLRTAHYKIQNVRSNVLTFRMHSDATKKKMLSDRAAIKVPDLKASRYKNRSKFYFFFLG